MIYEVKLKEAMSDVFRELVKAAAIENQLTGTVKLANEEKDPEYGVDKDVKLMSRESSGKEGDARATAPARIGPCHTRQAAAARRVVRRSRQAIREAQSAAQTRWRREQHHQQQSQ